MDIKIVAHWCKNKQTGNWKADFVVTDGNGKQLMADVNTYRDISDFLDRFKRLFFSDRFVWKDMHAIGSKQTILLVGKDLKK